MCAHSHTLAPYLTALQDFEQPRGGLVAENRHLRDKVRVFWLYAVLTAYNEQLRDLQQRFSVLEDDLTRLKPLLLLQGSNGSLSSEGSQTSG